jgi:DNA-binding SARP family transcriptional activator
VLQPTSVIWETVKKKRGITSLRKELSETRKRIFGDKYEDDIMASNKKEVKHKKTNKTPTKTKSEEGKTLPL